MSQPSLKIIIKDLLGEFHLLSVSEILRKLEVLGRVYNKTSVYRALENLLNEEVVCKHHFSESEAKYELREDHHTHLVCTQCGRVGASECNYQGPKEVKGFSVKHHHLTLFGLCKECSAK